MERSRLDEDVELTNRVHELAEIIEKISLMSDDVREELVEPLRQAIKASGKYRNNWCPELYIVEVNNEDIKIEYTRGEEILETLIMPIETFLSEKYTEDDLLTEEDLNNDMNERDLYNKLRKKI